MKLLVLNGLIQDCVWELNTRDRPAFCVNPSCDRIAQVGALLAAR